ncbi:hypothetical protein FRX31_023330 [Thalictrum thalictroides]|uniref:Uncharacterized protein n=1 Tax=Thalictrum thalictroides TaxID=46969 RepID=A0A7J6VPQ1_THATH|nr:hypothetical protein FRX31_023330 [Thalictrum thalictroides]
MIDVGLGSGLSHGSGFCSNLRIQYDMEYMIINGILQRKLEPRVFLFLRNSETSTKVLSIIRLRRRRLLICFFNTDLENTFLFKLIRISVSSTWISRDSKNNNLFLRF